MDREGDTLGRAPSAHREIERPLASIRRLVQAREGRRLEGAGDAEMAAIGADIRRLQGRLAEAVRRQLAGGGERRAPRSG